MTAQAAMTLVAVVVSAVVEIDIAGFVIRVSPSLHGTGCGSLDVEAPAGSAAFSTKQGSGRSES
jgi:hypothetical protein